MPALSRGTRYPGIIFARGPSIKFAKEALQAANQKLDFALSPVLPVI